MGAHSSNFDTIHNSEPKEGVSALSKAGPLFVILIGTGATKYEGGAACYQQLSKFPQGN